MNERVIKWVEEWMNCSMTENLNKWIIGSEQLMVNAIWNRRANGWMNEWMIGWINEWRNKWMNEWLNEWMYVWMKEWMIEWTKKTKESKKWR